MNTTSASNFKSRWPENLRVFASFAVVMIHVHAWDISKLSNSNKIGYLVIDLLCYWSVPVFIMLSGGLLLRPDKLQNTEPPSLFFKKRWRRMIRPTLVWAIVALLWGIAVIKQSGEEIVSRIATGTPNDPQWFLFMLLGLYLLTPWLRILLAIPHFDHKFLSGLVGLLYSFNFVSILQQSAGFTVEPIFPVDSLIYMDLYLLGIIVSNPDIWSRKTDIFIWAACLITTILGLVVSILKPELLANCRFVLINYHSPLIVLQAVSIYRMTLRQFPDSSSVIDTRFRAMISRVADWSFGIYVIHPFVLTILFKFFLRPIDGPFLIYCLVIWAMTMVISCMVCALLRFNTLTAWMIP